MSPRAQVATGLAVLVPVALGAAFVFYFIPWLWWLIFIFGWSIFPAFGLLVRGIAGLSDRSGGAACGERQGARASRKHCRGTVS